MNKFNAVNQGHRDRLFVALELSEETKRCLLDLSSFFPGIKWVTIKNLHLTLRFIGSVPSEHAELIRQALHNVSCGSFNLTIAGLGLYQREIGDVLWARVNTDPNLIKLRKQIDERLQSSAGLRPEKNDFSPHITLSRLRKSASPSLKNLIHEKAAEHFCETPITDFTLFRSLLRQSGAIHESLERYRLNS